MHRRIVAALLVPSVVPLLMTVLVQPRAGAQQPTVTPSPVATWQVSPLATNDAGSSPMDSSTITATPPTLTPTTIPASPVPLPTRAAPAEVAPSPPPVGVSASSQTPTAPPTPLSPTGLLGSIVPFAQTNPVISATIGSVVLVAAGILLFAALLRRRSPPPTAHPLLSPLAVLEGVTVPNLKFYLDREQMTIGRASNCDFRIPDNVSGIDAISRQHARFEKRGERWAVIDGVRDGELSTNGIFVNGKRTLENYLADDDEISFGILTFRFHARPANAQPAEGDPR